MELRCNTDTNAEADAVATIAIGTGLVAENKVIVTKCDSEDILLFDDGAEVARGFDTCLTYLFPQVTPGEDEWFAKMKETNFNLGLKEEYMSALNERFSNKANSSFINGSEAGPVDFALSSALKSFVTSATPQDKARLKFAMAYYSRVRKTPHLKKPEAPQRPLDDVTRLKLVVGVIKDVWIHPESDKLYCEQIDIGEAQPRNIASGLQAFIPIEQMKGAKVVVLANLKARNLGGFASHGMVMCASNEDHTAVELITPGEKAEVGDVVTFEGYPNPQTPDEVLSNKKGQDPLPAVLPHLRTDENCCSFFKEYKMLVRGEPVTCKSLIKAHIS